MSEIFDAYETRVEVALAVFDIDYLQRRGSRPLGMFMIRLRKEIQTKLNRYKS